MDEAVVRILNVVLAAARAQVALSVEVALQVSVGGCGHRIHADVELATFVEQWLLQVLLNYVGAFPPVDHRVADDRTNLIQIAAHLDSAPSVRVLTRLDDPETVAQVGVLGEDGVAVGVVEDFDEALELLVCITFFDVEGQRQVVEGVLAQSLVVALHIVVNRLLVAQMEIVLLVVACDHMVRRHVLNLSFLVVTLLAVEPAALQHVGVRARARWDEGAGFRRARSHAELLSFKS